MKKSRRILLISLPVMFAILLFLLSKNKHETVVSTSTVKAEVQSLTTVKETEQSVYVEIVNGAQLERDIIPQLMDVFHLSEDEVKKELSKAAAQVYSESSEMISVSMRYLTGRQSSDYRKKSWSSASNLGTAKDSQIKACLLPFRRPTKSIVGR